MAGGLITRLFAIFGFETGRSIIGFWKRLSEMTHWMKKEGTISLKC